MIVWLWDADGPSGWRGQGISDDLTAARRAAEGCLLGGRAETARVEAAQDILDRVTLAIAYRRLGHGWQAKRGAEGTIMWRELIPV